MAGGLGQSPEAAGLSVKAGIGYEFLSQRYFLDSAVLAGPDSALASWSLESTYLDDLKGEILTSWCPLANKETLQFGTSLEQTVDFLRIKATGSMRLRPGRGRLDINSHLEWRNRFGKTRTFGDSYVLGYSRAKIGVPINGSLLGFTRLKAESVNFTGAESNAYDYFRMGVNLGIEKAFSNFSIVEFSLLTTMRRAPDSSMLDYTSYGIEGVLLAFLPTGDLDLTARLEYRDYNRPGQLDDNRRFELFARNRLDLGDRWFLGQEVDLEGMAYSSPDWTTSDYLRLGGALLLGLEWNRLSVAAGPDFESLQQSLSRENASSGIGAEDYTEGGGKIDIDFLGSKGLFASLESLSGYRSMGYTSQLQTSFLYERLYLLSNIRIGSVLNLAVLFSSEWEWHEESSNNSELYLLSTSLSHSF